MGDTAMDISPNDFGASFKGFLDQMSVPAPAEEPVFRRRLRDHFECEPNELSIPLPDGQCRQRLFDLYSDKLTLGRVNWETFVHRTDGASAAFIREMMRKAALFAADESSDSVEDRHLDEAIHELVSKAGH
jgi:AAA+ superfamily predicted ATPase